MQRKKWTPKTEITQYVLLFREKRKWQIALRRYILMQNKSAHYAPYFGLDVKNLRKWIEIQFDNEMNWGNFSKNWQFDHIVPLAYFNFEDESELRLCWNFTNIKVEKVWGDEKEARGSDRMDLIGSKAYFMNLFKHTDYPICQEMAYKIEKIEISQVANAINLEKFMLDNRTFLETISSFSSYEFLSLNEGVSMEQIKADREFLKKFE
jgi:hypothetical protein